MNTQPQPYGTIHFEWLSRVNSRKSSYNISDVVRQLERIGYTPKRTPGTIISHIDVTVYSRKEAFAVRKEIEGTLLNVKKCERHFGWIFEFTPYNGEPLRSLSVIKREDIRELELWQQEFLFNLNT